MSCRLLYACAFCGLLVYSSRPCLAQAPLFYGVVETVSGPTEEPLRRVPAALAEVTPQGSSPTQVVTNGEVLRAILELRQEVSSLRAENDILKREVSFLKRVGAPVTAVSASDAAAELTEQRQAIAQQNRRIESLEAQSAGVAYSVDPVFSPESHALDIGCGCKPGLMASFTWLNLRARRDSTPFSGIIQFENGSPGDSFIAQLTDTEYNMDPAFRVDLGYQWQDRWDSKLRWTRFRNDGSEELGTVTQDNDNVYANMLDRSLVDDTLNHDFDDGVADFASQTLDLEYDVGDIELGRAWRIGRFGMARPFVGLRLARQRERADTYFANLEGADLDEYWLTQSNTLDAWGFRLGSEGRVQLGRSGLGVFGRSALSMMLANYRLYRDDRTLQGSSGNSEYRTYGQRYSTVLPVVELAAGVSYHRGPWFVSAGYEITNWFNMYQQLEVRGWDDVDGSTPQLVADRKDLSLDGWFLRGGLGW